MKRRFLTLLLLLSSMMIMAQEYHEEYLLTVGDTLIWNPFAHCNSINYKVSSKEVLDFKPLHYGEKVQVIALKAGVCQLSAVCGEISIKASVTVNDYLVKTPAAKVLLEKPETQSFNEFFHFDPPTDHFFITFTTPEDEYRETYAKIGNEEAYNNGNGIDRFWNIETGANYYYVPDAQGWTDDVVGDFVPFGDSFYPLSAFALEVNTKRDLSEYYIGKERVLDIDCWVFYVEGNDGNVIRYWVDPSNGCTLKRIVNTENPIEVTVYDLNYTKWFFGPKYKKSLHDKTR